MGTSDFFQSFRLLLAIDFSRYVLEFQCTRSCILNVRARLLAQTSSRRKLGAFCEVFRSGPCTVSVRACFVPLHFNLAALRLPWAVVTRTGYFHGFRSEYEYG